MDTESIGKILGGLLSGGVAGNVSLALAEGLKLANKLMEPDPAKRAKARREYYLSLIKIVKEVQGAKAEDISDLVDAFTNLMDE
jgi:hypothetical protein